MHYAEQIKKDTTAHVFDRMRRTNYAGDHAVTGGRYDRARRPLVLDDEPAFPER